MIKTINPQISAHYIKFLKTCEKEKKILKAAGMQGEHI